MTYTTTLRHLDTDEVLGILVVDVDGLLKRIKVGTEVELELDVILPSYFDMNEGRPRLPHGIVLFVERIDLHTWKFDGDIEGQPVMAGIWLTE